MIAFNSIATNPCHHISKIRNVPSYSSMNSGKIQIGHETSFQTMTSSLNTVSVTVWQNKHLTGQMVDSPVFVKDGKIEMKIERMEIGKFYSVSYSKKKYLITKTKKGVIDIYKVVK